MNNQQSADATSNEDLEPLIMLWEDDKVSRVEKRWSKRMEMWMVWDFFQEPESHKSSPSCGKIIWKGTAYFFMSSKNSSGYT